VAWLQSELQRLFADDYLQGLDQRSLDDLRAMRAECDRAETAVSYLRRVVQGRLDVISEFARRGERSDADLSEVVEKLPAIIGGGPPRPAGPGRLPSRLAPDLEAIEDDDLTAEIDVVFEPGRIGELPVMDLTTLQALSRQLVELEGRISAQRKGLQERMDTVQAEIVRRYKAGDVSPDGLLD
jgi:hypothetical protein